MLLPYFGLQQYEARLHTLTLSSSTGVDNTRMMSDFHTRAAKKEREALEALVCCCELACSSCAKTSMQSIDHALKCIGKEQNLPRNAFLAFTTTERGRASCRDRLLRKAFDHAVKALQDLVVWRVQMIVNWGQHEMFIAALGRARGGPMNEEMLAQFLHSHSKSICEEFPSAFISKPKATPEEKWHDFKEANGENGENGVEEEANGENGELACLKMDIARATSESMNNRIELLASDLRHNNVFSSSAKSRPQKAIWSSITESMSGPAEESSRLHKEMTELRAELDTAEQSNMSLCGDLKKCQMVAEAKSTTVEQAAKTPDLDNTSLCDVQPGVISQLRNTIDNFFEQLGTLNANATDDVVEPLGWAQEPHCLKNLNIEIEQQTVAFIGKGKTGHAYVVTAEAPENDQGYGFEVALQ